MSSIQQLQSIMHHGGGDHVDSCDRCTSMKLVLDSGIGLTPDKKLHTRNDRLLHGHAVATTASAVREGEERVVPSFLWSERVSGYPTPVAQLARRT